MTARIPQVADGSRNNWPPARSKRPSIRSRCLAAASRSSTEKPAANNPPPHASMKSRTGPAPSGSSSSSRLLPACIVVRRARRGAASSRRTSSAPSTSAAERSAPAVSATAICTRSTRFSIGILLTRLRACAASRGTEHDLLQRRLVVGGSNHRRPMMHHQQPSIAHALKDVGGEHRGARGAVVAALRELLFDHHDGEAAADDYVDFAEIEFHFEYVVENPLPARHDRAPSGKLAPSGMDTDDARVLEPDRFHLFGVEALERVV